MHGDLRTAGNIIVHPDGKIGVLDFGEVLRTDPHHVLSSMMRNYGATLGRKLVAEINRRDPTWELDFDKAAAQACVLLASNLSSPRAPKVALGRELRLNGLIRSLRA